MFSNYYGVGSHSGGGGATIDDADDDLVRALEMSRIEFERSTTTATATRPC